MSNTPDLTKQGADSEKHSFPKEPYEFQKFPQVLYKGSLSEGEFDTKIVANDTELKEAITDGWGEARL